MLKSKEFLSVMLVDDEIYAIANLRNLIETYCPSLSVIGTASNASEATSKANHLKPDVLFLDINMPGQNGFELLDKLNYTPSVVFVTAYEQYALKALKVSAADFILKPISIDELIETQNKLIKINELKGESGGSYNQVLRNLAANIDAQGEIRKITLYGNNGYELFDMDEIVHLSANDNYTSFYFLKHKEVMVSKTLKEYQEILEPFGFMRIHKSIVVNLKYVKKIFRNENMEVLLVNGVKLPVSRRRMTELLEWSKNMIS